MVIMQLLCQSHQKDRLQILAFRHPVVLMPFVEISRDRPCVSVYLNILVTPDKDVNQSASSTLTAVPLKSALTKNAVIHAQDYVATTQNVELSTILPLVTVLKVILEVRLNPARLSQLKVKSTNFTQHFHPKN